MAVAPAQTELLEMYEQMLLIRVFETEAERQYKAAQIGGYCHLSSGQEATCVGVIDAMQDDDLLVTGYRSHGFALARGTSPEAVMAGLALALVRQAKPQAVVCELGDGAVNMGAWHESLNLAALWKLPVVFLVVNNKYGMGTAVDRASAEPDLYKRASAYRMHGEPVDGDDLEAVIEASSRLLARARESREPSVLEAITYRYRGHSVADAGLAYRTKEEIASHQERDPLLRTAARLRESGATTEELRAIDERVEERVEAAVKFATESPDPDVGGLAWAMHSQGSDEQFARMRPGSPFGEEKLVFDGGLGK